VFNLPGFMDAARVAMAARTAPAAERRTAVEGVAAVMASGGFEDAAVDLLKRGKRRGSLAPASPTAAVLAHA
jgi:hypothetical protein